MQQSRLLSRTSAGPPRASNKFAMRTYHAIVARRKEWFASEVAVFSWPHRRRREAGKQFSRPGGSAWNPPKALSLGLFECGVEQGEKPSPHSSAGIISQTFRKLQNGVVASNLAANAYVTSTLTLLPRLIDRSALLTTVDPHHAAACHAPRASSCCMHVPACHRIVARPWREVQ